MNIILGKVFTIQYIGSKSIFEFTPAPIIGVVQ